MNALHDNIVIYIDNIVIDNVSMSFSLIIYRYLLLCISRYVSYIIDFTT